MVNIIQNFLTKNDCYNINRKIDVKGIMVHSTGCAQPNPKAFMNSWNVPNKAVCVHGFVGADEVYQCLPWNHRGWHAGGQANNTHIGFEICEPSGHTYNGGTMIGYDVNKNATYFSKIYKNAVELCAYLCKEYKLDPHKNIICHSEGCKLGIASNHADVMHWFPKHGKNMDIFRDDVAATMANNGDFVDSTAPKPKDPIKEEPKMPEMTQEKFNEMMDKWMADLANKDPAKWSETYRKWAEDIGLIQGYGNGVMSYCSFITREQMVTLLYRFYEMITKGL